MTSAVDEPRQMECRIVITHWGRTFALGMYDPVSMRHEPLGRHPIEKIDKIVGDLKVRMEKERHLVTFSEISGPR
jgi:hypothetical protein